MSQFSCPLPGERLRGLVGSALPSLLLLLAACSQPGTDTPLDVSVIGGAPRLIDRPAGLLPPPSAALAGATAQGLVSFDGSGQIQPALAERWIVADDGRSLIFRIGESSWADGSAVDAETLARRLRQLVSPASRNPLKPLTGAIEEIVAVTPRVIDLRLRSPRPNMLQILAQPEFAMLFRRQGSGPMVATRQGALLMLRPRPVDDPDAPPAKADDAVRLRGERASLAVARFAEGQSDGVLGGRFADLAIAQAASTTRQQLRFDPTAGLFGLVFTATPGDALTGSAPRRAALAMAVDRDAIARAFGVSGWRPEVRVVSGEVADLPAAVDPGWTSLALTERRRRAANEIAAWRTGHPDRPVRVRVALPPGPGSRLLLARLASDWSAIGVAVERAEPGSPADLRLIDEVAPGEIASWYLRHFACEMGVPCTAESDTALIAARNAPTLAERTVLLREADRLIADTTPFIPLGRPLRWSLVGPRLDGWRESPRGIHPLQHLRQRP